ncbi:hypothetical protein VTN77DRAFT_4384 [Rasamsonia byssochlamydoides]|uniref:uncharacterized protein n=1 Tax=Rasamsonia byssochlamydoides TaxID=89139 RepID=UPI0037420405
MRGLSRASQFQRPSRFPKDSQAKAKWRAGLKPTEIFNLPARYGTYKHHIIQAGREVLGGTPVGTEGKFEVFEQISQKTGAFVKQPSYNDKDVSLWGELQQVSAAKDLILQIVKHCNDLAYPRKRQDWAKINAHSVAKEDRIDHKEKRETLTQQLRRSPDPSFKIVERVRFPCSSIILGSDTNKSSSQLLFLWPNGELPMREVLGSELEVLDPIRIEFGYNIYVFEEVPEYICVVGQDHEALREVARRIRTKWHELMATSNVRSKVYLAQPPEPSTMRTGIFVKKIHGLARPSLSGSLLKDFQRGPWQERLTLIQSKNDARLLSATERSLRGLPFFRGHLRMRVNIGSFILDEYRLPRNAQTGYSFEEFREMLLHEKTRGRLVPG